jgi:hypothetical protein
MYDMQLGILTGQGPCISWPWEFCFWRFGAGANWFGIVSLCAASATCDMLLLQFVFQRQFCLSDGSKHMQ